MKKNSTSIFSDRRSDNDRRKQDLSMPAGMNRRGNCRRNRSFHSQPWWLKIDYAVELVSEKKRSDNKDPTNLNENTPTTLDA